jgi:hypothetical protein
VSPRTRAFSRGFTILLGLGYAVAAAITIQRAYVGLDFLRSFRWPLYAAEGAIFALIAFMLIAGATVHIAALAAACATIASIMIAKFDSESALAPVVGVTTGLLGLAYVRAGFGSIRLLPIARIALLVASVVLAGFAVLRMEDPAISLDWQRVRTPAGAVEVRRFLTTGGCGPQPSGPKDIDEIDSGCAESVPSGRAWLVIALTAASAATAIAALWGSPRLRRLSDGTEVPIWM